THCRSPVLYRLPNSRQRQAQATSSGRGDLMPKVSYGHQTSLTEDRYDGVNLTGHRYTAYRDSVQLGHVGFSQDRSAATLNCLPLWKHQHSFVGDLQSMLGNVRAEDERETRTLLKIADNAQ